MCNCPPGGTSAIYVKAPAFSLTPVMLFDDDVEARKVTLEIFAKYIETKRMCLQSDTCDRFDIFEKYLEYFPFALTSNEQP